MSDNKTAVPDPSWSLVAEHALRVAAAKAVADHKAKGQPIVIWRDGKVVWVPAEEIEVPVVPPLNGVAEANGTAPAPLPPPG